MGRFSRTWRLTKASWHLLKKDRELLWLPVLSILGIVVLAGAAAVIGGLTADLEAEGGGGSLIPIGIVFVVLVTAVGVFFEGALVAGAYDRMNGGDPTVKSAMGAALGRLPALLGWAIITASVGIILRALEERLPWLGRMLVWIADAAWKIITYLVVPAIVIDHEGPVAGIKRSGGLVRQTWGENLISQAGFGLLGFLLILPPAAVGTLIALFVPGAVGLFVGIGIGVAGVLTVMVVIGALSVYFKTALYVYATQGRTPDGFDGSQMRDSFRMKDTPELT